MADNYKPISLTSIRCNLFEKFVRKHLMDHFNKKGLITKHNTVLDLDVH